MPTSTYTSVMATSAAVNSAVAAHQATEARKVACVSLEQSFDPRTASVAGKQEYASCVGLIYDAPMSAHDTSQLKVCVGFGLAIWLVILVIAFSDRYNDWTEKVMFGIVLGFFGGAVGGFLLAVLIAAFEFLTS